MLAVLSSRRGSTLIDAMLTLLLVGIAGLIFTTCFPAASNCSRQAQEYKTANALAQTKMEHLRSLKYEIMNYDYLASNGFTDNGNPQSFTVIDGVNSQLTNGTGTVTIEDATSDMYKLTVTVSWISSSHSIPREIKLVSYLVDKRTRKAT